MNISNLISVYKNIPFRILAISIVVVVVVVAVVVVVVVVVAGYT
jgi:hypothetical protein